MAVTGAPSWNGPVGNTTSKILDGAVPGTTYYAVIGPTNQQGGAYAQMATTTCPTEPPPAVDCPIVSNQDWLQSGGRYFGQIHDRNLYDNWFFEGRARQLVNIRMEWVGIALDPFIRLFDSSDNLLAEDDDSGGNRIAEITFILPADGTYRVTATRYPGSPSNMVRTDGTYRLLFLIGNLEQPQQPVILGVLGADGTDPYCKQTYGSEWYGFGAGFRPEHYTCQRNVGFLGTGRERGPVDVDEACRLWYNNSNAYARYIPDHDRNYMYCVA